MKCVTLQMLILSCMPSPVVTCVLLCVIPGAEACAAATQQRQPASDQRSSCWHIRGVHSRAALAAWVTWPQGRHGSHVQFRQSLIAIRCHISDPVSGQCTRSWEAPGSSSRRPGTVAGLHHASRRRAARQRWLWASWVFTTTWPCATECQQRHCGREGVQQVGASAYLHI